MLAKFRVVFFQLKLPGLYTLGILGRGVKSSGSSGGDKLNKVAGHDGAPKEGLGVFAEIFFARIVVLPSLQVLYANPHGANRAISKGDFFALHVGFERAAADSCDVQADAACLLGKTAACNAISPGYGAISARIDLCHKMPLLCKI